MDSTEPLPMDISLDAQKTTESSTIPQMTTSLSSVRNDAPLSSTIVPTTQMQEENNEVVIPMTVEQAVTSVIPQVSRSGPDGSNIDEPEALPNPLPVTMSAGVNQLILPPVSTDLLAAKFPSDVPLKEPDTLTARSEQAEVSGEGALKFTDAQVHIPFGAHLPSGSVREEVLSSPGRSLTPLSESLEQTSPVELMENSDGSVKIKGELDHVHPSPAPRHYRSRSSSQSSKSSKAGSPGSRQSPAPKTKKKRPPPPKDEREHDKNDFYCWICHKEGEVLCCELCPRVMHYKCLNLTKEPEGDWFCPECEKIMVAECKETQSRSMSQLTIDQLALHLRYALQRMKTTGCEPFLEPVNTKEFTDYLDYVFHPMDLNTLEKNIKKRTFGCTEAFLADVKWILHNCIIYNGPTTKLTHIAKTIVKIAQHEMSEIEVCPECYLNACRKRDNWFCEPCRDIHVLVWAKLQGFPHWPAKALRIEKGMVDARFFGQHDRAWIPLSGCYLMSKEMPLPVKNKKKGRGPGAKGGLDSAMQEMQGYIDNVIRKTGHYEYAPPRTPLTHLDLYRKPAGQSETQDGSNKASNNESNQEKETAHTSITIKKEMLESEAAKSPSSAAKSPGERVLNLKIDTVDVSLPASTANILPKKKSKVVTTSGAHPQKGGRPFAKKKGTSLLQKTIESCKASLRETIENESDESSSDSDSSFDDGDETTSTEKSSPDKGEKVTEQRQKHTSKDGNSDDSDKDLIIDIPEDEDPSKKKDSVHTLVEKGIAKVKKRHTVEKEKELKPSVPKTKSILLNKEQGSPRQVSTSTLASGSTKRKLTEDNLSASAKLRKVDGGTSSVKTDKSNSTSQKTFAKTTFLAEKKKHSFDSDKTKKVGDHNTRLRKDVSSPSAGSIPKKTSSELAAKKKMLPPDAGKAKNDDVTEKSDLKSTAKLLAKKVMSRKHGSASDKPKSVNPLVNKMPFSLDNPAIDSAAKKLSSFTIPKHKPSVSRSDTESYPTTPVKTKPSNQAAMQSSHMNDSSQPNRLPSANVAMQKIRKYNDRVMQSMQQVLMEMYEDVLNMFEGTRHPSAVVNDAAPPDSNTSQQVSKLRLELEQLKWMHQQELAEVQHNHDLAIAEIRERHESEKVNLLEAAKRKSDGEKAKAIEETKRKQWCANCGREAIFYCCWNTSYCDYPCQQLHWPKHMATCSQARDRGGAIPSSAPTTESSNHSSDMSTANNTSTSNSAAPTKPVSTRPELTIKSIENEDSLLKDEDDHSDNDMMFIDESADKQPSVDLLSPESPVDEIDPKTGKATKLFDVVKSVHATQASTPASSSNQVLAEKAADVIASSSSSNQTQALAGAYVSALTSDSKLKSLPVKTSASALESSSAASPARIVPSKLIDDIFSKVQKTEITTAASSAVSSKAASPPSYATGIVTSLQVQNSDSVAAAPSTHGVSGNNVTIKEVTRESKAHSSGSMISAIGERLMKAKGMSSAAPRSPTTHDYVPTAPASQERMSSYEQSSADVVESTEKALVVTETPSKTDSYDIASKPFKDADNLAPEAETMDQVFKEKIPTSISPGQPEENQYAAEASLPVTETQPVSIAEPTSGEEAMIIEPPTETKDSATAQENISNREQVIQEAATANSEPPRGSHSETSKLRPEEITDFSPEVSPQPKYPVSMETNTEVGESLSDVGNATFSIPAAVVTSASDTVEVMSTEASVSTDKPDETHADDSATKLSTAPPKVADEKQPDSPGYGVMETEETVAVQQKKDPI